MVSFLERKLPKGGGKKKTFYAIVPTIETRVDAN